MNREYFITPQEIEARVKDFARRLVTVHNTFSSAHPTDEASLLVSAVARAAVYSAMAEVTLSGYEELFDKNPALMELLNAYTEAMSAALAKVPKDKSATQPIASA